MSFNSSTQQEITTWLTKEGKHLDNNKTSIQRCLQYISFVLLSNSQTQNKKKIPTATPMRLSQISVDDLLLSWLTCVILFRNPKNDWEKEWDEQFKRDPGAKTEVHDKKRNYLDFTNKSWVNVKIRQPLTRTENSNENWISIYSSHKTQ